MKNFKTVVVLKRPYRLIWGTMRDQLPKFASRLPNIVSVTETERRSDKGGRTYIVNEWRASYQLPTGLRAGIVDGDLGWTDRNCWDETTHVCRWTIEPYLLAEHVVCAGQTKFESAIGDQGARVTLEGTLELKPGFLTTTTAVETLIAPVIESIVTTIIPKSLRSTLEAAAAFVSDETDQPSRTL
jgi:hypothetical protein